ncbi:MAG TPA: glycosyl transferase [Beijerinckiaceae bacterium]|jgi:UDP-N-acetylmuramyl pentapeptide phosphotransferase/UDP-N-acetylglucosamine-1-phosphate transferase
MVLTGLAILASAALCAGLILLLRPLLARYALARPNARSSHTAPTPQGGGIAVVAAALAVATGALFAGPSGGPAGEWAAVAAMTLVLAAVGAVDDIRPLPPALRLLAQALAVGAVVLAAGEARLLPGAPPWLERALAVVAGVWFVNLVNFMDGIDWITIAGMAPAAAALATFGLIGAIGPDVALAAAALLGALLGFAPFNKPVARLFLGDVGSLPIGLLVAWMLYRLALDGALAAALLLPLYHVADATITLLRRLARGERVWEAHRTHFYQQATANGFSVMQVSGHVLALNLALAGLAALTLAWPAWPAQLGALAVGCALTGLVLARFATPRENRIAA